MINYRGFSSVLVSLTDIMTRHSIRTHRGKWQGVDVSQRPDAAIYELMHQSLHVPMESEDLDFYREEIKPNLPWADNHFKERVGGHPLNPGKEWANWPWGNSAANFRIDPKSLGDPGTEPIFDHTYAQRYFPKFAGNFPGGIIRRGDAFFDELRVRKGIYFLYGDLNDVVDELVDDPTTRQAILPVFFPEDTGLRRGRRKPCSLSYQFILNEGALDMVYVIRSCDFVRHLRDDIYLTVRLLLWMLQCLRFRDAARWKDVKPGQFIMHIANLHCFVNDMIQLKKESST